MAQLAFIQIGPTLINAATIACIYPIDELTKYGQRQCRIVYTDGKVELIREHWLPEIRAQMVKLGITVS